MIEEERKRILANLEKIAERAGKQPLWVRAVLGTRDFTEAELEAYKAGKSYVDDPDRS